MSQKKTKNKSKRLSQPCAWNVVIFSVHGREISKMVTRPIPVSCLFKYLDPLSTWSQSQSQTCCWQKWV